MDSSNSQLVDMDMLEDLSQQHASSSDNNLLHENIYFLYHKNQFIHKDKLLSLSSTSQNTCLDQQQEVLIK